MPPSMEVDTTLPVNREALRNTHPDRILSEFGFMEVIALPRDVAKMYKDAGYDLEKFFSSFETE